MHWSKLFIPTLRPTLRDDHPLLERAGYARPLSGGIHAHVFLAQRSLLKIAAIVREEMTFIGAQEFCLPAAKIRPEEAMASIARGLLRSYKQLPQIWFTTQASCSFDKNAAGLEVAYEKHRSAYTRILDRCGLEYRLTGGREAQAFVLRGAHHTEIHDPEDDLAPEEFHTPNVKTIADLARFTGSPETSQMKSLVMVADGNPVLALLRGDHQLSEAKLADALNARHVRSAQPEELRQWFGADAGSLGPIGVPQHVRILADDALRGRRNMIAGANKNDYHLRNVTPGEDFEVEFHDLRQAAEGDASALGHIFKLGNNYSKAKDLHVTNESGEEIAPFMGSYGIGIERILSAAAELYHDADGIALPPAIAPFSVVVTPVNIKDEAQRQAAAEIYATSKKAGLDVLLDDRDERPGVKFKDADLIGVPYRITVGKKIPEGIVELVERRPKRSTDVPIGKVVDAVRELWTGYL
jgi:prolyl-tRNA synthetase